MRQNKDIALVLNKINELLEKRDSAIIAIDGRCASGKTTLSAILQKELSSIVLHMDDFFLRPEQRTKERLSLPGGNVDFERFLSEVLLPLKRKEPFMYTAFDCKTMSLKKPIEIKSTKVVIVEGSYSCHPELFEHYDLTVFMDIEKDIQADRILKRNGKEKLKIFKERWIVLEERYFEAFNISSKCELYIKNFNL